jgi:hypothetical protein
VGVPEVPKKKYDDEALRARALELRSKGLSYREIARELGCSVFKVYQLISPYESPRSRIKQIHELATRVEELSRKLLDLEGLASRLEAVVKPPAYNLEADLELLCMMAETRFNIGVCRWMDREGYCTLWCFPDMRVVSGLNVRKHTEKYKDEVWECYEPNVLTHFTLCLICPDYEEADGNREKEILGDRFIKCENGRLVFRKPEESNP